MDRLFATLSTSMMWSMHWSLQAATGANSGFSISGGAKVTACVRSSSRIQKLLGKELKLVWKDARAIDVPVSIVSNRARKRGSRLASEDRARRRLGKDHCVVARRSALSVQATR